jgi:hypothetical protein
LMSRTKDTLACTYSRRNHTRVLHLALGLVEHQRAGDPLGPAGVAHPPCSIRLRRGLRCCYNETFR